RRRVPLSSSVLSHAPPPTELYALSLHDALPIYARLVAQALLRRARAIDVGHQAFHDHALLGQQRAAHGFGRMCGEHRFHPKPGQDRKSTRLNSSHVKISYAVFCLKKKKTTLQAP